MTKNTETYVDPDPANFSRGSLELTFKFLRKTHPTLALNIRNITYSQPIAHLATNSESKHAEHFHVSLDAIQVRKTVEALIDFSREQSHDDSNRGILVLTQSLIDDWMALARQHMAERKAVQDR